MKLTIVRGVSASGKSTWARQQNALVVSRDDIRDVLFPLHRTDSAAYYAQPKEVVSASEDVVTSAQNAFIRAGLSEGKDVVVDNTNIEWQYVKQIAKIGYRYGAEVETKVFDVDLNTALHRDKLRGEGGGRRVGDKVIRTQYERFAKTKNLTLNPVQPVKPYNGTPGKPKAFLVDIDGTLAHMDDLRKPFDWKRVGVDRVDEIVSDIVWDIWAGSHERKDDGYTVIVMSGRDESCRSETTQWLDLHGIPWNRLFMRPEKDMRPDNLIKAELFDKYVRDNYDVKFVLDDRDQVVEMWRRMGLKCLQVEFGDF